MYDAHNNQHSNQQYAKYFFDLFFQRLSHLPGLYVSKYNKKTIVALHMTAYVTLY